MDKDQMNEVFQGVVNEKFDTVVGKVIEKDGKYVFEGVALNKYGQIVTGITYVAGLIGLTYVGGLVGSKIGEKIADKIHQRKMRKAKAEAFDEMVDLLEKTRNELIEKHEEELKMSENMKKEFEDKTQTEESK